MAQNNIPQAYAPLIELLEDATDGLASHEQSLGVKQNTEAKLSAALLALIGEPEGPGGNPPAKPGLKSKWNDAKAAKTASTAALRSAKSAGRAQARACVNTLKQRYGEQWTNAWQTAGFTGGSLAIPDNPLTLLQQLRAYYGKNPSHEVLNLGNGFNATAAACQTEVNRVSDASSNSNATNEAAGLASDAYNAGLATARDLLSGLREELSRLMRDDDPRWYAFGFERPDDPETPEVPENLVLTASSSGNGQLFLDWDDARRAESYRARALHPTTNAELAMQLVEDSDATLTGLPVGIPLRIEVTAINPAGESQPLTGTITL